jgi:hypothetical protein
LSAEQSAGYIELVRPITSNLSDESSRPYFLWDEDTTTAEFRCALRNAPPEERWCLIGRLMREARDPDVWLFVTPDEVRAHFDKIRPHLGRRRVFWDYLIEGWQRDGLVS